MATACGVHYRDGTILVSAHLSYKEFPDSLNRLDSSSGSFIYFLEWAFTLHSMAIRAALAILHFL